MAAPQLQLQVVQVRIAKPDQAGHDPAPQGTTVWLDVPTGVIRDFNFQQFVVNAKGTLDPAGGNKVASIDRSVTYWSLWSPAGKTLTLPQAWDADNLAAVTGFGRPLLAVVNDKNQLVLPNTRKVIVREFNLTGGKETAEMKSNRAQLADFYKDLHVAFDFQAQPKPKGQADLFVDEGSGGGSKLQLHDLKQFGKANAAVVDLPLTQPPFAPPDGDDKRKTVVVIWVKDFVTAGKTTAAIARAEAYHPHRLLRGVTVLSNLIRSNPPDFSVIFISSKATLVGLVPTTTRNPEPLAHEFGHVLWADAGDGRRFYNDTGNNLGDHLKKQFQGHINDLFIKKMGLDIPEPNIGQFLESDEHSHLSNNLMFFAPANAGSTIDGLTFTQVGLFRLAPELLWPTE